MFQIPQSSETSLLRATSLGKVQRTHETLRRKLESPSQERWRQKGRTGPKGLSCLPNSAQQIDFLAHCSYYLHTRTLVFAWAYGTDHLRASESCELCSWGVFLGVKQQEENQKYLLLPWQLVRPLFCGPSCRHQRLPPHQCLSQVLIVLFVFWVTETHHKQVLQTSGIKWLLTHSQPRSTFPKVPSSWSVTFPLCHKTYRPRMHKSHTLNCTHPNHVILSCQTWNSWVYASLHGCHLFHLKGRLQEQIHHLKKRTRRHTRVLQAFKHVFIQHPAQHQDNLKDTYKYWLWKQKSVNPENTYT